MDDNEGYVKYNRHLQTHDILTKGNSPLHLYMKLRLLAAYKPRRAPKGDMLQVGQCSVSDRMLAKELCCSKVTVRANMKKLEDDGLIIADRSITGTIVTVVGYAKDHNIKIKSGTANEPPQNTGGTANEPLNKQGGTANEPQVGQQLTTINNSIKKL